MNAMRGFGRWMRGAGVFQVRYQPRVSTTWAGHVAVVLSLLAGAALRVEAQYPWRTELRPDGTLIVFKTSPEWGVGCPTGDLVIPSTVNGRRVTSIGTYAFQGCSGLTRVTIPDSVTGIEYGAFERCTDLADITFGKGLLRIGGNAFLECTKLTRITIPDGVTSIGDGAFGGCAGLSRVAIPLGVTRIGALFPGCTGLTNVAIPDGVTNIGDGAFWGCTNLTSVTIPAGVTRIGGRAFSRCYALRHLTLPDSVSAIWTEAFSDCTGLTAITIPDAVTLVWEGAFLGCTGLTNLTIGRGVTSIGDEAFYLCTGLTSITIPRSVANIGFMSFGACAGLQTAYFDGDSPPVAPANVFRSWDGNSTPTTVHYRPGTSGWGPTFAGRPTAPWVRPHPTILDFGSRFGPSTNGFGFVISWATNVPVVVESSADLDKVGWTPISTNTLTDGWVQFDDPEWKKRPTRFYRVRSR